MVKLKLVALVSLIVAVSYFVYLFWFSSSTKPVTTSLVKVTKVYDGDTIELASGKKVRLIGVDAPEKGKPFYEKSKNRLRELIEDQGVTLEKGTTNIDQYGRLLRYIYRDETFVNLLLIEEGYASVYLFSNNEKFKDELLAAEKYARENELGLWKPSKFSRCIEIEDFHYNAKGKDSDNLNDEYVVFKNICSEPIELTGWSVSDNAGNLFNFPKTFVQADSSVTLFSGYDSRTSTNFYWGSEKPIWNNKGDVLFLRDTQDNLILSKRYAN